VHLTRYLLSDIAALAGFFFSLRLARRFGHALCSVVFWLVLALAFPLPPPGDAANFEPEQLLLDLTDALPQERPVDFSARVMLRLEQAEKSEENPHYRDDVRVSWICVLKAFRGEAEPHVLATYAVLGLHPDAVWSSIQSRRRAKLGADYNKVYTADGRLLAPDYLDIFGASSPKKPVQSERRRRGNDRKAG
jgi:hypothetical protein